MADDKKTQMGTGTGNLARPTGASPSVAPAPAYTPVPQTSPPAVGTGAPVTGPPGGPPVAASQMKTSYLPGNDVDPLVNAVIAGRYLVSRKLGEGGMGAVYLATHQILEKQVALKVLHGEFARKPDLVERFMQEAKSASRIRHENVIDISDFGQTPEGLVFFAMELLKGHDLHEEVARARLAGQLLPWARTKPIFLQICSALTAAHGHGIVHRDLKPENIYLIDFLGEPDFVKLLDFGIAKMTEVGEGDRKLTRTGMLFGTPEYMSPEQARGDQVDHRVDIYAMGCILFQLVTGRVPFEADNFMGVLSLHLTEPPPAIPLEVFDHIGAPREIAQIIDRALLKDREQRWSTIAEMANAIRVACGDAPVVERDRAGTPVPRAASVAAPATTTTQRQRTQWTGKLAVPEVGGGDTQFVQKPASKLPLILGIAAVVIAGGGVAAFMATRGHDHDSHDNPANPGPGSGGLVAPGPGSNGGAPGPGSANVVVQQPTIAPDAGVAVAPPPVALPTNVTLHLESKPAGAEITDLASNHVIGHTPMTLNLRGSHESRQYVLHLKGYSDTIVELVPDQPDVHYVAPLEKGAGGASPVVQHVPTAKPAVGPAVISVKVPDLGPRPTDPVTRPDVPVDVPTIKPVDVPKAPPQDAAVVKPPEHKPEDEPDDGLPHIKTNIPGLQGSAAAAAPAP